MGRGPPERQITVPEGPAAKTCFIEASVFSQLGATYTQTFQHSCFPEPSCNLGWVNSTI